ncbi:MAG: ATP-binding protein [Actinomycetota bacterium]|nr:ATP-binding protein [Actinomycetota bacterium]
MGTTPGSASVPAGGDSPARDQERPTEAPSETGGQDDDLLLEPVEAAAAQTAPGPPDPAVVPRRRRRLWEERTRSEELSRSESTMILVRWPAAVFATVQVLFYEPIGFEPDVDLPTVRMLGLVLAAVIVAGNTVIALTHRLVSALPRARVFAAATLTFDVIVASAFVWLYAFDPESALWAVLFILPLEGAIRFRLGGALAAWGAATAFYAVREVWASGQYDYPLLWNSISFRMGIGFLIALVAGLMARDLTRQRSRLQAALVEVHRVDRLRSRLVSTLAHDVRNPLTTIRGALKTLLRHPGQLTTETGAELLAAADTQAGRLERLAADLLDLARLERGRLELTLEDVRLEEAVTRAVGYADDERRVEVRIDPELVIRADPGRLEQIVVNLVSNALRYGRPPYVVEAGRPDGHVELLFRDHGPGVSEEEREVLFEPFRTEQDHGSVGFGLAIVKALVEAHGGSVTYEANEPRGACFRVSLPAGHGTTGAHEGTRGPPER